VTTGKVCSEEGSLMSNSVPPPVPPVQAAEGHWVLERTEWDSVAQYLLYLKQRKAYEFATQFVDGKRVLDYGVGSGFGTALLAKSAESVEGVDLFAKTISYCNEAHDLGNLNFQQLQSSYHLPFDDDAFDVVSSFQVIEHVPDVKRYLVELKRVLAPGGILLITTPNRAYRLLPFQKPWNDEHIREYSKSSLAKEMGAVFDDCVIRAVSGTPEINEVEHRRVRQTPLKAYVLQPARRLVRRFSSPGPVVERAAPPATTTVPKGQLVAYSTDDFTVGDDAASALDWLAQCRN